VSSLQSNDFDSEELFSDALTVEERVAEEYVPCRQQLRNTKGNRLEGDHGQDIEPVRDDPLNGAGGHSDCPRISDIHR
jgi:hypothetical protein